MLLQGTPLRWGTVFPQLGQTQLPPNPRPEPPILPRPLP